MIYTSILNVQVFVSIQLIIRIRNYLNSLGIFFKYIGNREILKIDLF